MATTYASGSLKIPGLGNGTNWQEMVDKLEQIEMRRMIQLGRWKNDWNRRLDGFNQLGMALAEYSSALKSINTEDKFMAKIVTSSNSAMASIQAAGTADNTTHNLKVDQLANNSYASILFNVGSKNESLYSGASMGVMTFTLGGQNRSLEVPPGTTLEGLKNIINQRFGSPAGDALGMKATIIDYGGKPMLQLYSTQTGAGTDIVITDDSFLDPVKDDPLGANGGWLYQSGQNAKVRVNGYPADDWIELKTNTLNSIPGLTINLQGVGETTLSISLDVEHIKNSIHKFVEATNAMRTVMNSLTRVDANKFTVSMDYADSQFETQKGGVLTGNYGAQLVASKMKTLIMSKPVGFSYMEKDSQGSLVGGDIFSSLAQLGIKTDDQPGSVTYGLLVYEDNIRAVLNGQGTLLTLDDAISMDPEGIAALFAAKNKATVDSSSFGLASMVEGQSKAGEYKVRYEVKADGSLDEDTIFINGKKAKYYPETNQIMLVRGEGPDNPADGILLDIYDNTPTAGQPHTGTIRIKQGMLNDLISMVDTDFLEPDRGDASSNKGIISVLQTQYKNIINNINDKIAREDERLNIWRRRMDMRYALLDATLKRYADLQTQVENQIKSLSVNSGGS